MAGPLPFLFALHHYERHHHQHHNEQPPRGGVRRRRTVWVRDWLTEQRRRDLGHYYTLLDMNMRDEAEAGSHEMFRNYTRIKPPLFLEILDRVTPIISRQNTIMRLALEPGLKLTITLRYLATGDSYHSLAYAFRVAHNTISTFLPGVCRAIREVFEADAFPGELSEDGWKAIAEKFHQKWNMPHALGALDGKHVAIKKPRKSGSLYHNYKGFFSIPLLALVDAEYQFLWAEIGGVGHMSDAQIFLESDLREDLETDQLNRPAPCPLTDDPEDTTDVPYFIVSDDAFALKDYCLKPYSKHTMVPRELIFNYRLSRARRVVENAFGLLAQRFRVFLGTCELQPRNVREVLKACMTLHNIILQRQPPPPEAVDREDENRQIIPGDWRQQVTWPEQPQPRAPRADNAGKRTREILADFFGSPAGRVPWQWERARVRP